MATATQRTDVTWFQAKQLYRIVAGITPDELCMASNFAFSYRNKKLGNTFLNLLVTGDESWLHCFNSKTKQGSTVWKSLSFLTPMKVKITPSVGKVWL